MSFIELPKKIGKFGIGSTVKPFICENIGTIAKVYTLGDVHISEVFS